MVIGYYAMMHLAGAADRRGKRRIADWLRRFIPIARVERGCAALLGGSFRLIVTEGGGCAADIDNDADYDASLRCFNLWRDAQRQRVERLYGLLPAEASGHGPEGLGESA